MAAYLTPGYKASAEREEEPASEKQITGQISIEDYLNDWQNSKKKNQERYSENLRQRVLQDTGEIFVEFEQENDKIMDTISAKAEEASKSDPDKEYQDFINSIMVEEETPLPEVEELEEIEDVAKEATADIIEEDSAAEEELESEGELLDVLDAEEEEVLDYEDVEDAHPDELAEIEAALAKEIPEEDELLEVDPPIEPREPMHVPDWGDEDLLPIMKDGKVVSDDSLLGNVSKQSESIEEDAEEDAPRVAPEEDPETAVQPEPVEAPKPAEAPKPVPAPSYNDDEDDFEFADDLHGGHVEEAKDESSSQEKSEEEYYYSYEDDEDDYEYGVATGTVAAASASAPEPEKDEDDDVSEEELLQAYMDDDDDEEEDAPRVVTTPEPAEEEPEESDEAEEIEPEDKDEEVEEEQEDESEEEPEEKKPAKSKKVEEPKEDDDEEESQEKKPARRRPVEDDDEDTPDRNMTEDETALFSNFVQTKGAKKKLIKALDKISLASYTGNVFVIGDANEETAELSKAVLKYAQNTDSNFTGKTGKVTGASLNDKPIESMLEKMANGGLIIEKPSRMNAETVKELLSVLDQDNHGILIIMQDTQKAMHKMMDHFDGMKEIFNVQVQIEELSDDTLVAYGRKYAEHLEYAIDDMGMLALHTKIESMQTSDHIVTVADVRAIIDAAIDKSNKKNIRHFSDVLLGKRYDEEDMIILKERDFED